MEKELILNVQKLRGEGKSFGEIGKELLITKSQARYCSNINIEEYDAKKASREKYIDSVCELASKCTNINQILRILGKKSTNEYYKQINRILEEKGVDTSHFIENERYSVLSKEKIPINKLLVSGSTIGSSKLRDRILNERIKEHRCERCKRTEWEGESIPLQLHHINGDRTDNRIENLQLLCPNCHSLTDNYCGRKLKKVKEKHYSTKSSKIISKEQLINDLKDFGSFKAVGEKYKVSDKTIVKWCEKYLLPTKSKNMREYIRSMFGDIRWKFSSGNENALRKYQKDNFRKIILLDNFGNVEKIYNSLKELTNDGFDSKGVYRVCKGELKKHRHRTFKFLEN